MNTLRLEEVADFLIETVGSDLQISTLKVFLFIVHRGSCTQRDVEKYLSLTNSSASRNVSYWTDSRFDGKPGLGFIMRVEDPHDRRYRLLTLTNRGRSFVEKLRSLGEPKDAKTERQEVAR